MILTDYTDISSRARVVLKRTVPPGEYVSLDEAKAHCRVISSQQDALIQSLVQAATSYVEKRTNRALLTQTWRAYLWGFPSCQSIQLRRCPVQTVTYIKYSDLAGNPQVDFSIGNYRLDKEIEPAELWLGYGLNWPSTPLRAGLSVEIEFIAGYGDLPSDVPPEFKQAILLLVDHWRVNTSAVVTGNTASAASAPLELAVDALLANYKIPAN